VPAAAPSPAPAPAPASGTSDDGTHHSLGSGSGSAAPAVSSGSGSSTATFSNAGGAVTVSCQGTAISLTTATPFNGYSFTVQNSGPQSVVVYFNNGTQQLAIHAYCDSSGQAHQGFRDE
jgi:hypothetical protein